METQYGDLNFQIRKASGRLIGSNRRGPRSVRIIHFDNLIAVDDNGKIKLEQKPENLVFLG